MLARLGILALLAITLPAHATILLVNATIHTMDDANPTATAMAWDDAGTLLAVGERAALERRWPDARRIDQQGATIVPGLIDAHGHLAGLGMAMDQADLVGASSKKEIISRLRKHADTLPPDAWLLGRGWDQNRWPDGAFPDAADLDATFASRPVFLVRIDGHAAWVNDAAMAKASKPLDGGWQPQGGRIERVDGKASGILIDTAMELVRDAIDRASDTQLRRHYQAAMQRAVATGLTGVHDAGTSLQQLRVLQSMARANELPLRVYAMANGDSAALDWLCKNQGPWQDAGGRLQMRTVKLFMDGALGSRGAALLADYNDDPGNTGILVTSPEDLRKAAKKAHHCGIQAATHAIGDRGNRLILDIYADVLSDDAGDSDHRWRIEHAQIVANDDFVRLRTLGLIASMQPTHATSDMPWAGQRLGDDRLQGAYAWREMAAQGIPLALGSDFPIEDLNPMHGLHAAITRQDLDGLPLGGWLPQERLSRMQALRGFTRGAAYAAFMEDEVGMLRAGMRADFVVLDADPMQIEATQIGHIKPRSTWLDGKAVWSRSP